MEIHRLSGAALLLAALPLLPALGSAAEDPLARGETAYMERASGHEEGRARPEPIATSIRSYEKALGADPDRLHLRWRLLRSLYYQADFESADAAEERARYRRGTEVSEEGIRRLARAAGSPPHQLSGAEREHALAAAGVSGEDTGRFYFWAGVHWGGWARGAGLLQAVRQGVAERMRAYTEASVALTPGYERGGPLRLLSRLHAELPRVPFLTPWVDRDRALPLAERAVDVLPDDVGNRYLLALTLIDLAPERRDEALSILREVSVATPRADLVIEDLLVIRAAQQELDALGTMGSASAR